jgi:hypothetical protein
MSGYQNIPNGEPTAPFYPGYTQPAFVPTAVSPPVQPNYSYQPAPIQVIMPPRNNTNVWPKRPFGWNRANWYFTGMVLVVGSVAGTVLASANEGLVALFSVLFSVGFFVFTVPCLCCCGIPIGMTASEERENEQAHLEMVQKISNPQTTSPASQNNIP